MKKIWQKSLASMVSAALCLTAFVGCLTVNAADYQGTVTSTGATVSTEDTQATVTLKLSSTDKAMNVAAIKVSTEYGSLASVNVGDYKDQNYKIDGDFVTLDTGKLFVEAIGNEAGFTTADVVLTFNKAASVVEGTYPVKVLAFAGETAASWDEKTVNLAVSGDINITVTSSHTHTWKFVSGTPATGSDNSANTETAKGTISLKCECGATKDATVNYSYYARTAAVGVNVESETLLTFASRYERDFSRITTGANITDGYIVLSQKRSGADVTTLVKRFADCEDTVDSASYKVYQANIGMVGFAMSDDVTSTVYAYDATTDAWYSGINYTYSVKSLSEEVLSTSTSDAQKTLFVNLLNYGTNAQIHFNVNTANPANAGIDAYQSYATVAGAYDGPEMSLPLINKDQFSFYFYRYGLLVESKITNQIFFRLPSAYSGASTAVDMTGYTVEVTYTDFAGVAQTDIYTADTFIPEGRTNRYYVDISFKAPDLRSVVSYVVKNADGVEAGPVATMSIENLVEEIVNSSQSDTQITLLNSMMAFSDAANNYLSSK